MRETRGFDEATASTFSLRKKENEDDYGFIVDSDLVPTTISGKWLQDVKDSLPELPEQKALRFAKQYGLRDYDAKVIAADRVLAGIFEHAAKVDAQIACRIVSRELSGILSYNSLPLAGTKINGEGIAGLVLLLKEGKVSDKNAKESLIKYALEGAEPGKFLSQAGLLIDSSSGDIETAVRAAIEQNPDAFEQFRAGNSKSLNFLIGIVMRGMKGKADARSVQKELEKLR